MPGKGHQNCFSIDPAKIIFVKLKSQPQHHQRMKDSNEQDIYIHTHQKNKDKQGNE